MPLEGMTSSQRFPTLASGGTSWTRLAASYLDHVGRLESLDKTREWLAQTLGLPREGNCRT